MTDATAKHVVEHVSDISPDLHVHFSVTSPDPVGAEKISIAAKMWD